MGYKKNSLEARRKILLLERKYPVDTWQIEGIHIWPYIRIQLFIDAHKTPNQEGFIDPVFKRKSFIQKNFNFIIRLIKSIFSLKIFFKNLHLKEVIFFGSHIHRNKVNGEYFNRFFDPMVASHKLQNSVYMVEFQKVFDKNYNKKAIIPLTRYLEYYKTLRRFRMVFKNKTCQTISLKNYENFHEELCEVFSKVNPLKYHKDGVIAWGYKISNIVPFFDKFFQEVKPKKIIMASYYGFDDLAAAMVAANNIGITTVDFQHGPQSEYNLAYSEWWKIPKKNFNTMPLEYWTWDKSSKENIEKWSKLTSIKVYLAGHPFIPYYKNNYLKEVENKTILYSLQPTLNNFDLDEIFHDKIIEVINKSKLKWNFRLHPRSNYSINEISEFLNSKKLNKKLYTFENPVDVPLPEAFCKAIIQISNWSGCLLEARMFGLPTILIHPIGKEVFSEYIDNKLVFYLDKDDPFFNEKFEKYMRASAHFQVKESTSLIFHPLEN